MSSGQAVPARETGESNLLHPLVQQNLESIREWRGWLARSGLAEILALYDGLKAERQAAALLHDLPFLSKTHAELARLLFLGESVSVDAVPAELLRPLDALGLAVTEAGQFRLAGYRLVRHYGLWILCEQLNPSVRLYHGDDSRALSRIAMPSRGRCLDLCAGVGTQGLLCAFTADAMVAVEKQALAEVPFWTNAVLNGLDHKVEFRLGDLTEPVRGERFDHVVCNPPLLPVPERLSYPLVGDGGPDGLALTRRVLEVLPALLNEDGRCHIVGTCLGGPRGPDTGCFEEAARDLRVFVMFPWRDRLVPGQPMFESLVASVCLHGEPDREMVSRTYERHLARAGATHLYSFFFYAFRGAGQTGFECSRHFMDPRTIWGR